jgi:hypothetical protein
MLDLEALAARVGVRGDITALVDAYRDLREENAKLHADAAAMRGVLQLFAESGVVPPAYTAKAQAALDGSAGKQLAERYAELVEYVQELGTMEMTLQDGAAFSYPPKPPKWLDE